MAVILDKLQVLIETYWNVKLGTTAAMSLTSGINRNILECKAKTILKENQVILVLIETYWNVKK